MQPPFPHPWLDGAYPPSEKDDPHGGYDSDRSKVSRRCVEDVFAAYHIDSDNRGKEERRKEIQSLG
jgi:hypothetical protein